MSVPPPRYTLTERDLVMYLRGVVAGLRISGDAYDAGTETEAGRLAVEIRKLVHHQGNSRALLVQLGIRDSLGWIDTAHIPPPPGEPPTSEFSALIALSTDGTRPWDFRATDSTDVKRILSFDQWWTPKLLGFFGNDPELSRDDLVMITANQAGGAHVDPTVSAEYYEYALREQFKTNRAQASVRQIAREVLLTLEHAVPDLVGPIEPSEATISAQLAAVRAAES